MACGCVRRAAVVGAFYCADPGDLIRQVEWCFCHPVGPGRLPVPWGVRRVRALVVPHAGLIYSGPVAAHAYLRLAESRRPEVIVVTGPDHSGAGPPAAVSPEERWQGPLGEVLTDHPIKDSLRRSGVPLDSRGHRHEHSIEVQLPFLQFLGYDGAVVPIVMADQDAATVEHLAHALVVALQDQDAILIASTDLSHHLPHKRAVEVDRVALEALASGDGLRLLQDVARNRITMCGVGPAAAVLEAARRLGCGCVEVLRYSTSGDVTGELDAVVGYVAAAVEAG